MDLSNIKPNQIIKNYRELCELTGEVFKGQKELKYIQMMNFKRLMDLKEHGSGFVINEIYNTPLHEEIKKSDYLDEIGNIIVDKTLLSIHNPVLLHNELMMELKYIYEYIPYEILEILLDYSFRRLKDRLLLHYQGSKHHEKYKIHLILPHIKKERISQDILENNYSLYEMEPIHTEIKGIYCIVNTVNNKKYIGRSKNIYNRIKIHLDELKNKSHHNYKLQEDYNTYGENAFKFLLLEESSKIEDFPSMEHSWIFHLGGLYNPLIYNISDPLKEVRKENIIHDSN
jgi:hypothetical protein